MIAGTRCTISGLKARPDLNGLECVSHRYDIKSARYLVDIEGEARVGVKGCCLTPCEYSVENNVPVRDVNGHDDTAITVHGLLYCPDHRLEVCGACCFNFRSLNLIAELGGAEEGATESKRSAAAAHAAAVIKADLKAKTPSRRAPGPQQPVAPRAATATKFDSSALARKNFDPSSHEPWEGKLGEEFRKSFTPQELFAMNSGVGAGEINFMPTAQQDSGYHLRVTLSKICSLLDQYQDQGLPYGFIAFQNESQSEALMLRVVDAVRTLKGGRGDGVDSGGGGGDGDARGSSSRDEAPALVCVYMYNTAGDPQTTGRCLAAAVDPLLAEYPELGKRVLSTHRVETEVIRTLKQLLDDNRPRLASSYVEREASNVPGGFGLSVFTPVFKGADQKVELKVCAMCGVESTKHKACSRCKTTFYCSRECQKGHYKVHRKRCKDPTKRDESPNAAVAVVDLSVRTTPEGYTIARLGASGPSRDNASMARVHSDDRIFAVKIQANPLPTGISDAKMMQSFAGMMGMMVYDCQRKFSIQITPGNCADFLKLHAAIMSPRAIGYPGVPGRKAYMNCFLKKGKLHVLYDEFLPQPAW